MGKKSSWIIELESADVRSAIIEEKAQLACQLEKKTLEVEKLKEENSDIRVTLEPSAWSGVVFLTTGLHCSQ